MQSGCWRLLIIVTMCMPWMAWGQLIQGTPEQSPPIQAVTPSGGDFSDVTKPDPKNIVPKDTIIIKGAWSSASDSKIPVPEGSSVSNNIFTDPYFGISYPLPPDWVQKYTPPPPSDTGRYVLSQISRADTYKGEARGSILFTAHDMFFTPVPAANARQYVNYTKNHLPEDYQLELKPTQTTIAGQPFTFFAYWSVVAQLHWYVLATEIRCHTVEIVLMNHDPKALEELVGDMDKKMKLPVEASSTGGTGGGNVPVCLKDYAQGENVAERVDPVLTVQRYNAIPVRIIINKEGKIRYIHFLSAYPEQEKTITDALKQWKFRPYEKNGQRLEVETGLMFGRPSLPVAPATPATTD